jgi:hypothetical protein
MIAAWVNILRCADGSYYVGSARGETLHKRIAEDQSGALGGYTRRRDALSNWFGASGFSPSPTPSTLSARSKAGAGRRSKP